MRLHETSGGRGRGHVIPGAAESRTGYLADSRRASTSNALVGLGKRLDWDHLDDMVVLEAGSSV